MELAPLGGIQPAELAPLSGIQPAELAKSRLKVISDQFVSFAAEPRPGWLHKNLW